MINDDHHTSNNDDSAITPLILNSNNNDNNEYLPADANNISLFPEENDAKCNVTVNQ